MDKNSKQNEMAFVRQNYIFLIAGVAVVILGFILMSGGASDDPNVFSEGVFSTRRLTVAPIVLLAGFGLVFYAIMKKPKAE